MRSIFLAAACATALLAGSGAAYAQSKPLAFCSEGSPENFGPMTATSGTSNTAAATPIYNRLIEFDRGSTDLVPGLAESYDISPDGMVYTLKLRKGVKFHTTSYFKPTRDFNADDVLFTINRQFDKSHPYNPVNGGKYEYFNSLGMGDALSKVEKVDDHTIRLTIKEPLSPFATNLAMDFMSIYSAEYADKLMAAKTPEKIDLEPIGTGAFQFVAYQKDAVIRYRANADYWKPKTPVTDLIFAITPDAAVRFAKLKANECQVMALPAPADIAAMKADANLFLAEREGLNVGYLAYNVEKKPLDDVRVRKALNMAVNKGAIIQAIYLGAGKAAKNPMPPTIWGYNDAVQDDPYDPAAAKKLLADAGFANGFETDIWAMPVSRPYNPGARRMAEMIQADWEKIGVKAKIVTFDWGEYLKRGRAGEHQTYLLGWTGDTGDPDNFLFELLGCAAAKAGGNRARWCNQDFEALVQKARKTGVKAERTALYEQAQVIFKKEAPWLTVAHSVAYVPMRKGVEGFKMDPLGRYDFYGVTVK